jgi:ubiquinone/menaquinone biosynthesis C-methylase UbiE
MSEQVEKIKNYWDERAKKYSDSWRATLGEKYLRFLEIRTINNYINKICPENVLDVGCGNGYSTKENAKKSPHIQFIGIDYSDEMIAIAKRNKPSNCHFMVADVTANESLPDGEFDLIITQRCIQNLENYETQRIAINTPLSQEKQEGTLLLMEFPKMG